MPGKVSQRTTGSYRILAGDEDRFFVFNQDNQALCPLDVTPQAEVVRHGRPMVQGTRIAQRAGKLWLMDAEDNVLDFMDAHAGAYRGSDSEGNVLLEIVDFTTKPEEYWLRLFSWQGELRAEFEIPSRPNADRLFGDRFHIGTDGVVYELWFDDRFVHVTVRTRATRPAP
jgi:hypothetical protein